MEQCNARRIMQEIFNLAVVRQPTKPPKPEFFAKQGKFAHM